MCATPQGIGMPLHLCQAKVNLFLEIQTRRPDGFHDIGTLFHTLEIADSLTAEASDTIELIDVSSVAGDVENNLVMKAVRLLSRDFGERIQGPKGLRLVLEKKLPAGAGLGGGSSDAAGALILANQVWGLELTPVEMAKAALALGSDVPYFLAGAGQFAEGRGEILTPAPDPFPFHVVVATPQEEVGSGWAYRQLNPPFGGKWGKFKALYHTYCEDPGFYRMLHNDFEAPVLQAYPAIAALKATLESYGPVKAMLTGSGSSVIGLFEKPADAQTAYADVAKTTRFSALTTLCHP
jgi:4-diphosphocytidyl-2-C-methyl-D-erythritol kinase